MSQKSSFTRKLRSQSGVGESDKRQGQGSNRDTTNIRPQATSLKEFRVAGLSKRNTAMQSDSNIEMTTPSVPDLVEPSAAIAEVDQAGAASPIEEFHELRSSLIADLAPYCLQFVKEKLDSEFNSYVARQIETSQSEVQNHAIKLVQSFLEEQKSRWEVPNTLLKDAIEQVSNRLDEKSNVLYNKVSEMEGNLQEVWKAVNALKTSSQQKLTSEFADPILVQGSASKKKKSRSRRKSRDSGSSSSSIKKVSSSDESDDSSSDEERRLRRRLRKTLTELNPSNQRFRKVLSYKNYRLLNRNPSEKGKIRRRVASWTKRMSTSVRKFDGTDPISVLQFLAKFKRAADNNAIPEGGAKLVLRNFLEGRVAYAFEASLDIDVVSSDSSGIRSWPEAVHWLLQTYAKDAFIYKVVTDIRALKQRDQETEYDFGHRVLTTFSRIPGVYSQADQVTTFVEGLNEAVAAGVTRDRQVSPDKYISLQEVMDLANSHGIVDRVRRPESRKVLKPTRGVHLLEKGSSSNTSSGITPMSYETNNSVAALAVEHGTGTSPPSTPTYSTYPTSELTNIGANESTSQGYTTVTALPIVSNQNANMASYAQPYRPGWIDRGNRQHAVKASNPMQEQNAQPQSDTRSCFFCASLSHYVPDCPFVTEAVRMEARKNIAEATPQQRNRLPKWTYALAGMPYLREPEPPKPTKVPVELRNMQSYGGNNSLPVQQNQGKAPGT